MKQHADSGVLFMLKFDSSTEFPMPRILIIAKRNDMHSDAVSWGLNALGHEAVVWYWEDFPKNDSAGLWISNSEMDAFVLKTGFTRCSIPFDVIWVRRSGAPVPVPDSHPDDVAVITTEANRFLNGILPLLGHSQTRWVNHPDAEFRGRDKVHQLCTARTLGFRVPETFIGNDIGAVREFFRRHPAGIVHKSFAPHAWDNEDGSSTVSRTSQITAVHLEREFAVRGCPAIYQAKVEKKHELRITVIGDSVFAAVIDSQRDGPTIDWRHEGGAGRTNLTRTELAPEMAERCRALCRQLGLAFGCIDLIVTPSDEVVFLEINCAGQFLFKELVDPQLPMLDRFCRFLIHGDESLAGQDEPTLRFADFRASLAPAVHEVQ